MKEIQKYTIFKDGRVDIFSKNEIHCFRADRKNVISAGFWDGEKAYGESTTLGVKSRPEDTEIIINNINNNKE